VNRLSLKTLIVLLIIFIPQLTFAFSWSDLWQRPDQQAANALKEGHAKQAAETFTQPMWKGVANYRAKDYKKSLQSFSESETSLANYNRGNALAHIGKYKQAIKAYDQSIEQQSNFEDAIYNRDLLKKLLEQQKQQ